MRGPGEWYVTLSWTETGNGTVRDLIVLNTQPLSESRVEQMDSMGDSQCRMNDG